MANGFPLAAVVGRGDVMDAASQTWISSTLASESTALAAAGAVLDHYEAEDVCAALAERGRAIREGVEAAIARSGIEGVRVDGIDPMWFLRWEDARREQRFLDLALLQDVLFKRGPYNFASLAHTEEIVAEIEAAASNALVELLEEEQGRAEEEDEA
jgi:glutamate-1-semialdehyde aminotransferase